MRMLDDSMLSLPVLIEGEDGTTGSGFYIRKHQKIFLVTAEHVLKDNEGFRAKIWVLTSYRHDDRDSILKLRVHTDGINAKTQPGKDIILLEVANVQEEDNVSPYNWLTVVGVELLQALGTNPLMVPPESIITPINKVMVSNDVYIIGYPSSLGDEKNFGKQIEKLRPLLRKGVISGINRTNETIILDCAAYFGNSGGVAIEIEIEGYDKYSYKVIGVVSEFIPFVQHSSIKEMKHVINTSIENSGYSVVIPMDTIIKLTSKKDDEKAK